MKNFTKSLLALSAAALSTAGASATISFSFSTGTPAYQPTYHTVRSAPVCRTVINYDVFGQPYWSKVCNTVRRAAPVVSQSYVNVVPDYTYDNSYYTTGNTVYYTNPGYDNRVDNRVPSTIIPNPQNSATRVYSYPAPVRLR